MTSLFQLILAIIVKGKHLFIFANFSPKCQILISPQTSWKLEYVQPICQQSPTLKTFNNGTIALRPQKFMFLCFVRSYADLLPSGWEAILDWIFSQFADLLVRCSTIWLLHHSVCLLHGLVAGVSETNRIKNWIIHSICSKQYIYNYNVYLSN